MSIDDFVKGNIEKINNLHSLVSNKNWEELNREGFVFELERANERLKHIYEDSVEIQKELEILLEKDTPNIDDFISEFKKELTILESNLKMEKAKRLRVELINETEQQDVPELYSSLQNKILELILKARYENEKVNKFLSSKKMPFVQKGNTAKNLLELLGKREEEINSLKKQKNQLKRDSVFGKGEKSVSELESELNEKDKSLEIAVRDADKALSTHLAQLNYVEGSFNALKNKVNSVEQIHSNFSKMALDTIKKLKTERDYARKVALEIEEETLKLREEYTRQLIKLNEDKTNIEERVKEKYMRKIQQLEQELRQKNNS